MFNHSSCVASAFAGSCVTNDGFVCEVVLVVVEQDVLLLLAFLVLLTLLLLFLDISADLLKKLPRQIGK